MRILALNLLIWTLAFSFASADELRDGRRAYTSQNYEKALKILTPLAEQGNGEAQFFLGLIYGIGEGVPKDIIQAHKWYNLAASGSQFAGIYGKPVPLDRIDGKELTPSQIYYISSSNLRAIETEMTPAQIWEARNLAREWSLKFNK